MAFCGHTRIAGVDQGVFRPGTYPTAVGMAP
jgi:hypothetical protein